MAKLALLTDLQKEIEIISKTLYIQRMEDWYDVPKTYLNYVPGISKTSKKYH